MPLTLTTNRGHITIYADDHGLDQLSALIDEARADGSAKQVGQESSLTIVREKVWTPR